MGRNKHILHGLILVDKIVGENDATKTTVIPPHQSLSPCVCSKWFDILSLLYVFTRKLLIQLTQTLTQRTDARRLFTKTYKDVFRPVSGIFHAVANVSLKTAHSIL